MSQANPMFRRAGSVPMTERLLPGSNGGIRLLGRHWPLITLWLGVSALLISLASLLVIYSPRFDWQLSVEQMPTASLGLMMAVAGSVYLAVLPLIRRSLSTRVKTQKNIFVLMLSIGLLLRAILCFSEPALEDDYNRYLWEGALTAHAVNPYAVSPLEARQAPAETLVGRLAQQAGPVLARVNHSEMSSNYPPVAQSAFALAYLISPWNLNAWRIVSLAGDVSAMVLLLLLLREAGRSPLWAALYWWNPIVIKELANSAHMDGIVVAFVLAALLLSAKKRHMLAVFVLGLAVGTKLWPLLLAPLITRRMWPKRIPVTGAMALLIAMTLLWLAPALPKGSDFHSGYVAYAQHWTTNSALFPAMEALTSLVLRPFNYADSGWLVARAAAGLVLAGLSLWVAMRPISDTGDLMRRAGVVVFALVLLIPAQFPWYMIWMVPFLAFRPHWGLLATAVTVPLYYLAFHFLASDEYSLFTNWVVWAIWIPVWSLLAAEILKHVECSLNGMRREAPVLFG